MKQPYVIVADDDADQRELLGLRLRREGFAVETVSDGKELLELLERAAEHPGPSPISLVISDLMMPDCTGWEVLEAMRRRRIYVPVLVVSAVADLLSYTQALALGAKAVLKKPFEWGELRAAVFGAMTPVQA
jgi:two-component system OmpR family response regulator